MSMENEERYINLEKKVVEIDSKQKSLEERFHLDLGKIYEVLKKLEIKIVGGGLDNTNNSIGLIHEMRSLKSEMESHTKQTEKIQLTMQDIKTQLLPSQQIIKDVEAIKIKLEGYEKYKYIVWGIILAAGWALNKVSPFIEQLLK